MTDWDQRFLGLAKQVAQWSKDPSTKVGAVIVNDSKKVLGIGYNGLPQGVVDDPNILHDRSAKYATTIHAEINALINAEMRVRGCTLFTWPFPPCSNCGAAVAQAGIRRVVSQAPDDPAIDRWGDSFRWAHHIFESVGIQVDLL